MRRRAFGKKRVDVGCLRAAGASTLLVAEVCVRNPCECVVTCEHRWADREGATQNTAAIERRQLFNLENPKTRTKHLVNKLTTTFQPQVFEPQTF